MWSFKKKEKIVNSLPKTLYFKSGQALFEYQCKYGQTSIKPNQGVIAIVVDAKKEFGVQNSVKIETDGSQMVMLRVVSPDGGFLVHSRTPSAKGDRLEPGELVIWVPLKFIDEVGKKMGDPRFGWIGLIQAKIAPELDLENSRINTICEY